MIPVQNTRSHMDHTFNHSTSFHSFPVPLNHSEEHTWDLDINHLAAQTRQPEMPSTDYKLAYDLAISAGPQSLQAAFQYGADIPRYMDDSSMPSSRTTISPQELDINYQPEPNELPLFPPEQGQPTVLQRSAPQQQGVLQTASNAPAAFGSWPTPISHGSPAPTRGGSAEPTTTGGRTLAYTCTYGGCTQRFKTRQELQQHKKNDHRQSHGSGAREAGMSQNGPHRCYEAHPVTGKICNTSFSRPYDLTRHQHTVHERKEKVRCEVCGTMVSRLDALTRHRRDNHSDKFPELANKAVKKRKRDSNG